MIPLRDDVPSRRRPVVNWLLIAINLAVFVYELTLDEPGLARLLTERGLVPARLSLLAPSSLGSLLTSVFLHGGLLHLASNVWTLWIFGDNVEDRMGPLRYLAFYLSCGLLAGVLQALLQLGSTVPTIGASGAIAGVLGAYFLLYPTARVVTLIPILFWPLFVELPAFFFLGFWFLIQLYSGTASWGQVAVGGVAWWAHVGGFVAGLALHRRFLRPRRRATIDRRPPGGDWQAWR